MSSKNTQKKLQLTNFGKKIINYIGYISSVPKGYSWNNRVHVYINTCYFYVLRGQFDNLKNIYK